MFKKLKEEALPERVSAGLKDGGHVYLKCSSCLAVLMDIWVTRPHEKEIWKVRASCPFCGDKSFVEEIKGGFHQGGYGKVKEDDAESDFPSTAVTDISVVGDTFFFTVKKANENAKPLYRPD